jgi:hypothetical protein
MTSALIAPSLKPGCNSARHPDELKERAEQSYARARAEGGERLAKIWSYTTHQLIERDNPIPFTSNLLLARVPVTIEEFVESPDFLGNTVHVWPTLMADLSAMNPDVLAGEEPVHEAYLGGAAGIGKSMMALITTLYQVYRLTCFRDPHGSILRPVSYSRFSPSHPRSHGLCFMSRCATCLRPCRTPRDS